MLKRWAVGTLALCALVTPLLPTATASAVTPVPDPGACVGAQPDSALDQSCIPADASQDGTVYTPQPLTPSGGALPYDDQYVQYPVTVPSPGLPVCPFFDGGIPPCYRSEYRVLDWFAGRWYQDYSGPIWPVDYTALNGETAYIHVYPDYPALFMVEVQYRIYTAPSTWVYAKAYGTLDTRTAPPPPPPDENHPPVAAFSFERVNPNDSGLYRFTSEASDPDAGDSITSQTWDFGDGGINVGPQVIHTFAKPGDYAVTHRVVDSHGLASTSSQVVHVPAPSLHVAVTLPDAVNDQLAPGVATRAHVTVTAGDDGLGALSSVAFVGDPLQATPAGALTVDTPLVPAPTNGLSLTPGESREFDAVVHGDGSGRFTLAATARAVDAAGREVAPVTGTVEGTISGLAVQLRSADTGEDTIDVVVAVTNQGTAPIDGIQYTGGGLAVHPEYVPDALRGTVTLVSGPRVELPTRLEAGETREATYTFHAEGPGDVAVVAEATAPAADGSISANDAGFIGIQKRVIDTKALKNLLVELAESDMVNLQDSARLRQQLLNQAMNARVLAARAQGALLDLPSQLLQRASGPIVPYPEFDNATLTKIALYGQAKGLANGVGKVFDFALGTPAEYYASMITSGSFGQMAQDYVDSGLATKGAADTAAYGTFSTALNLYDRYVDDPGGALNQQQYTDLTDALNDEYKGQMLEFAEYSPQLDAQGKAFDQYLEQQGDAILRDPYGWADKVTTAAGELEGETLAGEAVTRGGAKLLEHAATSYEYSRYGKSGAAIKRVTEADTLEALGAGETTAANVERLGGITQGDQRKIQQVIADVKEKFGVDLEIQARPSNPYSVEYLNSKLGALGKPEIFKAKNLSDIDVILGADAKGLGKLGVFEPKLPPDGVLAKMPPELANEVKLRFKTQEGVWKDWNDPTSKFAKNYKKASQPGGGTFEFDVPTAKGDVAPGAPREYEIEVGITKPGRNNTVSFYEKGTGRPIVSDIDFHGYFKTNGKPLDAG
ncbi:MAG TPA: PKD domain-containing protein, partial [Acidimicrobiia bacterium]